MVLRRFPGRLIAGGLLIGPVYNGALYFGQQFGVPASVASLITSLLPIFILLFAPIFLAEKITARTGLAFLIALAGMLLISVSRGSPFESGHYGTTVAWTVCAPLAFAIYTILSKSVTEHVSALTWTYLTIGTGGVPLLLMLPWHGGRELQALPAMGWFGVLYLTVISLMFGISVWSWLLRHLPASTLGLTVFLNPPMTAVSKFALAAFFPTVFVWALNGLELAGGLLALVGLAIAVRVPEGAQERAARTGAAAPIVWKLHLAASPQRVFTFLDSDEGRASFWAEEAVEVDGVVHFVFADGTRIQAPVIRRQGPEYFEIEYFGSLASFELQEAGNGGTDLTLTNSGVEGKEWAEVYAGWLNVLLPLKAAVDFGVDLRCHDRNRTWVQRYVDQ